MHYADALLFLMTGKMKKGSINPQTNPDRDTLAISIPVGDIDTATEYVGRVHRALQRAGFDLTPLGGRQDPDRKFFTILFRIMEPLDAAFAGEIIDNEFSNCRIGYESSTVFVKQVKLIQDNQKPNY